MTAIGLGDIAAFPFLDPPDRRAIADGIRLLEELGALETGRARREPASRLTPSAGSWPACRSIPASGAWCSRPGATGLPARGADHRRRPVDPGPARAAGRARRRAADQLHARFADGSSDFLAFVNLWTTCASSSGSCRRAAFRRMCRASTSTSCASASGRTSTRQLRRIVGRPRHDPEPRGGRPRPGPPVAAGRPASATSARRTGDTREYLGARNARFAIFPGSSLAKKPPEWVMAAELVETSRLWARTVARIEPEWAEELGAHLVKRSYSEPHWSTEAGQRHGPRAGHALRPADRGRPARAARPGRSRAGPGAVHPPRPGRGRVAHATTVFVAATGSCSSELEELEHRFRRRDLVDGDDTLERLYDERLPDQGRVGPPLRLVVEEGARTRARPAHLHRRRPPHRRRPTTCSTRRLPRGVGPGAARPRPCRTSTSRASPDDGVAVHVPVGVLNQLRPDGFDWLVPGLREELVTALVRVLPKDAAPQPGARARHVRGLPRRGRARPTAPCSRCCRGTWAGPPVSASPPRHGTSTRLPPHLRMTFRVEDPRARCSASRRTWPGCRSSWRRDVRRALSAATVELRASRPRRVGLRRAAPSSPPRRRGSVRRGLPGARRRGRVGRSPPGRLGRRAGPLHVAGRATAAAPHHPAVDEGGAGPPHQRHPPRPRHQPLPVDRRPARGLRHHLARRPHARPRGAGLERHGLRRAAGVDP